MDGMDPPTTSNAGINTTTISDTNVVVDSASTSPVSGDAPAASVSEGDPIGKLATDEELKVLTDQLNKMASDLTAAVGAGGGTVPPVDLDTVTSQVWNITRRLQDGVDEAKWAPLAAEIGVPLDIPPEVPKVLPSEDLTATVVAVTEPAALTFTDPESGMTWGPVACGVHNAVAVHESSSDVLEAPPLGFQADCPACILQTASAIDYARSHSTV